jgi:hypothetical protein
VHRVHVVCLHKDNILDHSLAVDRASFGVMKLVALLSERCFECLRTHVDSIEEDTPTVDRY